MKRTLKPVWMVLAVIVAMIAFVEIPRLWAPKEVVPWRTDLAAARAESARVHKPVMLYFTADWCGYCREMAHTTWADPAVGDALKDYVPVKIDADARQDLADHYGVRGLPSLAVLDENGDAIRFTSGAMSSARLIAWLH